MRNRKRRSSSGPNQSYLISFGDTMTALLAFFIVLNSLASEQTGANLYSGTGSFIRATDTLGVPGIFPSGRSPHAIQLTHSSPLYLIPDSRDDVRDGDGPDEDDDSLFLRDRELDDFERMLNELERLHSPSQQMQLSGEVAFDWQEPYWDENQQLAPSFRKLMIELRALLNHPRSQLEIVVWISTPRDSNWQKSALVAARVREQLIAYLQLSPVQAKQVICSSRQWMSAKLKRPQLSLVMSKAELHQE